MDTIFSQVGFYQEEEPCIKVLICAALLIFNNTFGKAIFQYGSFASELHFQKFLELLQLLKGKNDKKVILFLPPLALKN